MVNQEETIESYMQEREWLKKEDEEWKKVCLYKRTGFIIGQHCVYPFSCGPEVPLRDNTNREFWGIFRVTFEQVEEYDNTSRSEGESFMQVDVWPHPDTRKMSPEPTEDEVAFLLGLLAKKHQGVTGTWATFNVAYTDEIEERYRYLLIENITKQKVNSLVAAVKDFDRAFHAPEIQVAREEAKAVIEKRLYAWTRGLAIIY